MTAEAPPRRRGRPPKDARPPGSPSTKELIVLAAAEAFAGRGFDGANLVDIAAAAGVTTGAVYSHFRGKPELLADVVTSTLEAIDPLRRADPAVGPEALHEWTAWLLVPAQTQLRSLIAEINHAAARDAEVRSLLLAYSTQYGQMLAAMIERWQRGGLIAADRPPATVAQLFLTEASGLCVTGALRPDVIRQPAFLELVHRQLAALLGEIPVLAVATGRIRVDCDGQLVTCGDT
ncbi:MAG: TetR family transcriptional regulator, partial [Ilumatobacteraceae bacterium]